MQTKTPVHLRKIGRPTANGKTRQEWHLRWHGTDGKHYCKKLGNCNQMTKRDAEAKRRETQVEMDRNEIPRDRSRAMTLSEFAEYHEKMIGSDRRPTTIYEYKHSAKLAEEALGSAATIQAITAADVGKLRNRLKGSAATRAKHISRLRAMFNNAKRWGLIHGENPFANQPMPRFTARSMRIFPPAEIEAMIEAAPVIWWKAFILLGVTAGPRKEEMLNLMSRDLDVNARTISITPKKAEKFTGPDGKEYETLECAPKTYANRTIPIARSRFSRSCGRYPTGRRTCSCRSTGSGGSTRKRGRASGGIEPRPATTSSETSASSSGVRQEAAV